MDFNDVLIGEVYCVVEVMIFVVFLCYWCEDFVVDI